LRTNEDICVFGNGRIAYNPQGLSGNVQKVIERRGNWKNTVNANHTLRHISMRQQYEPEFTNYPKQIIKFPTKRNDVLHPTEKPVALLSYLIRTYTNAGDTVLDFCMGSGTTGCAAVKEGRHFVGVELDAGYFAIAQKRIEQAQYQLPLLEQL
jgi:site-specific DNA-methyltransferase (adenine-specific)